MELQLAAKLGVSRTPIREAIRMLEQEGLAVTMPRKGAEVAKMTLKDMEDVLEIREALDEQTNHPDIDALMKDIREKDFDGVCAHMGNVLESVTIPNYPVIAEIKQQMMRSGAKASMMSGSGPTVFGLFEDGETAKRALREMKRSGLAKQVYLTTIYNNRRK